MLDDKLNQNVEKETDKVVHVSRLRRDTGKDNQLVRNDFKKLASNLEDKINRHAKSSEVNDEILRKEVILQLSATRQEIDAFIQDVDKKNQKFQNWICSTNTTELETGKKIAEINEEVIELKRQIADIQTIRVISYVIIFVLEQFRSSLNLL